MPTKFLVIARLLELVLEYFFMYAYAQVLVKVVSGI